MTDIGIIQKDIYRGQLYYEDLISNQIDDKNINIEISCKCDEKISYLLFILTGLQWRVDQNLSDSITEELYKELILNIGDKEIPSGVNNIAYAGTQIPLTEEEVFLQDYILFDNEGILNTTTTKKWFILITRPDKDILSIIDLDGGDFDDITNQYIFRKTLLINDILMNVYAMQVAIPYLTNHRHKIILE